MRHLDEGTIHAWLDGELPDDQRTSIERHVAACAACAARVAEARGMIAGAARIVSALDDVPGGVLPKVPVRRGASGSLWRSLRATPGWSALAAGLLVVAASMLAKRHQPLDERALGARQVVGANSALARTDSTTSKAPAVSPGVSAARVPMTARPAAKLDTSARAAAVTTARRPAAVPAAVADAPAATSGVAGGIATAPRSAVAVGQVRPAMPLVPNPQPRVATAPVPNAVAMDAVNADARVMTRRDSTVKSDSLGASNATSSRPATTTAPARREQRAMQLTEVRTTALESELKSAATFAGCYRVTNDSLLRAGLPPRFALQLAEPGRGATQNLVRAVSADGRVDTVLAGSTWQEQTPRIANVSFVARDSRLTVRLQLVVLSRDAVGGQVAPQPMAPAVGLGLVRGVAGETCKP